MGAGNGLSRNSENSYIYGSSGLPLLGDIIFKRSYAHNPTETWRDCAERVAYSNTHIETLGDPQDESALIHAIDEQKWMPAGRHLWAAGLKRGYPINCFVIGWERGLGGHLYDLMVILSAGGGVGSNYSKVYAGINIARVAPKITYSVQHSQLDTISDKNHYYNGFTDRLLDGFKESCGEDSVLYRVPDTREGWGSAFSYIWESARTGYPKNIHFDLRELRNEGAPLVSSGGFSSGPMPLACSLMKISELFSRREGSSLDAVDLMEIDHYVACAAVMGNKRRSARMSILNWDDPGIKRFLSCKLRGKEYTDHHTTNISVALSRGFWNMAKKIKPKGALKLYLPELANGIFGQGEPGIWNQDATKDRYNEVHFATNPCQPAWAPVLTPSGISTFKDIKVGSAIWSGKAWTKVTRKVSSGIKPVYSYRTAAGAFVGTENHCVVQHNKKIEVGLADSIDVNVGPPAPVTSNPPFCFWPNTVMDGLVLGDGMLHKASDRVVLLIGENDESYFNDPDLKPLIIDKSSLSKKYYLVQTSFSYLPKKHNRTIPDSIFYSLYADQVRSFLRGLYSANGSVVKGSRITLKATSFALVDRVQQMLSSLGISSYYITNKPHELESDNGIYACREIYDLNIGTGAGRLLFKQLIGFIQPEKTELLEQSCQIDAGPDNKKSFDIIEKTFLGEEEVFDITVDAEDHTYWSGGLLVSNCGEIGLPVNGNCNLGHIVLSNITSQEELVETARLGTRFLLRSTEVAFPTPQTEEVAKKERRIGLGLIGIAEWGRQRDILYSQLPYSQELLSWLTAARKAISQESADFCKQYKIPLPATETTIAPTGTISNLLKSPSSSGIEPYFAEAYIRSFYASETTPKDIIVDPINRIAEIGVVHQGARESAYNLSLKDRLPVHAFFQKVWCGGMEGNSISVTYNISEPMTGDKAFNSLLQVMDYMEPSVEGRLKGFTAMPLKSDFSLPNGRKPIEPCSIEDAVGTNAKFFAADDGCTSGSCELRQATVE